MAKKSITKTSLSWNDRFAIIQHYHPDDKTILKVFDVSQDELDVACQMLRMGTFTPSKNVSVESYSKFFTNSDTVTSHVNPNMVKNQPPVTASKPLRMPKKRGRKGDKILQAFKHIPMNPTALDKYANSTQVSVAVLKQSKRFDKVPELGQVVVRKDKETHQYMIWRQPKVL